MRSGEAAVRLFWEERDGGRRAFRGRWSERSPNAHLTMDVSLSLYCYTISTVAVIYAKGA
jgi:hypothetical protein